MVTDQRSGLATAVELIGIGDPVDDAEQGDIFDGFEADANLPLSQRARGLEKSGSKGGRPKGARNRSTEEWRSYLLSRYRSPLVGLLELCNRSPAELAKEMGLYKRVQVGPMMWEDRLDTGAAAAMQMDAYKTALPYLHQKAPTAIEIPDDVEAPILVIGNLTVQGGASDGVQIPFADVEQNQQVIDVTPAKSDARKSEAD